MLPRKEQPAEEQEEAGLLESAPEGSADRSSDDRTTKPDAGNVDGEGEELTAEQQAVADKAIDLSTKMLYEDEKVADMVVGMIRQEPFAQGIGDAAALIVNTTAQAMKGEFPREAAPSLLMFIVGEIMSIGAELKFFEATEELAKEAAGVAAAGMDKLAGTNTLAAAEQVAAAEGEEPAEEAPQSAPAEPAGLLQQGG